MDSTEAPIEEIPAGVTRTFVGPVIVACRHGGPDTVPGGYASVRQEGSPLHLTGPLWVQVVDTQPGDDPR